MHRYSFFTSMIALAAVLLPLLALTLSCSSPPSARPADPESKALALLARAPLIDGHNDLPWALKELVDGDLSKVDLATAQPELHTDIPRLEAGRVGGQFWSVYVPGTLRGEAAVLAVMEQIDLVRRLSGKYPEKFHPARTAKDVEMAFGAGRTAALIGLEGGHSIGNSLAALRMLHELGARYMTLTHSANVDWADSATDIPRARGLTEFGREVIREMNRLGMLVDLSHTSPAVMRQAIELSAAPVIFSHSSARALCDHPRNVPDDILGMLRANGGIAMVTFVPAFLTEPARQHSALRTQEADRIRSLDGFTPELLRPALAEWDKLNPQPRAAIADVADHIDHMRKIAGIDHIGIGSDYDGTTFLPQGLEDVSRYPALVEELVRRGYADEEVMKITGRNILRVMSRAEAVARQLQRERRPSEARIADLDGPRE